jgi:hypothetical protein
MSSQTLLSGGDKWYSYSGEVFGDVSAPATISMILIPNTGLRDSLIVLQPFYSQPVGLGANDALGIMLKINDVIIYNSQMTYSYRPQQQFETKYFVPRQSKLEVISLNTSGNNTQERGANVIGYYL